MPCTVRITNYKKDGSTFVNNLCLMPVHDSEGEYRYVIAVQSDATHLGSEGKALEKLRSVMPKTFDAAAQALKHDTAKLSQVDLDYGGLRRMRYVFYLRHMRHMFARYIITSGIRVTRVTRLTTAPRATCLGSRCGRSISRRSASSGHPPSLSSRGRYGASTGRLRSSR